LYTSGQLVCMCEVQRLLVEVNFHVVANFQIRSREPPPSLVISERHPAGYLPPVTCQPSLYSESGIPPLLNRYGVRFFRPLLWKKPPTEGKKHENLS